MNRNQIALFALVLAWPGAALSQPTAEEACGSLKTQAARLLGGAVSCQAQADILTVEIASQAAFDKLRAAVFPQDRYASFQVVRRQDVRPIRRSIPDQRVAPIQEGAALKSLNADYNFDNAAVHKGAIVLAGGPPGSTPPGSGAVAEPPVRRGPPGSTPPGSQPPGSRPPGSRLPGNDAPPPASAPPSRPTPVIIPQAPSPNYWNTIDWGTVSMWSDLPSDWEQSHFDEASNRYVTRWYARFGLFTSLQGYSTDSRSVRRRAGVDVIPMSLTSREVVEVKQCYYQGVYNLSWNSYEGSWDGRFSHYRAACKRAEEYGSSVMRSMEIRFDMQGRTMLPWETETVRGTFDGRDIGAGVENPAFRYSGPIRSGDSLTFRAEAKLPTRPDEDGVSVELVPDHVSGRLKLRVYDKWAGYYKGETLEVAVKLMYVTKGWFSSNEPVDVRSFDRGNQIRLASGTPPGVSGSGASYEQSLTAKGCGKYYIESWSFKRANNSRIERFMENMSYISSGAVINKGGSERIQVCR